MNRKLEWVRPPRQARSQQTLERLLDAGEKIIAEKGVENATVSEIAKRAGSSVGAFYSRFQDKEGLVQCVFERFNEQALATAEVALEPSRWDDTPIQDALETMVRFMIRVLRERRGLLVAMFRRASIDPTTSALGEVLHDHLTDRVAQLIEHRRYILAHPDPRVAVDVAVWMTLSSLQSRIIYARDGVHRLTDEVVAQQIAQMAICYLGIDEGCRHDQTAGIAPRKSAQPLS